MTFAHCPLSLQRFRFQSNNHYFCTPRCERTRNQKQLTYSSILSKADIVSRIADATGMEKHDVQTTVEAFMATVRESLESGENVYLRGFGSFVIKTRAAKTGRNILAKTSIEIPAHNIPSFKPAREFVDNVKENVKVED